MSEAFEPTIIAYTCHFCPYEMADKAGEQGLSYPTNVSIIEVPCTGRIDVIHLLRAFQDGADGVYVVACKEGECHHKTGNLVAKKRLQYTKKILDDLEIGSERLEMRYIMTGEVPHFARIAQEMTDKIRALGPSPVKNGGAAHKA